MSTQRSLHSASISSAFTEKAPWARVMVGGAVLTREYAASIGADGYGHDAMAGVRLAEEWEKVMEKQ